MTIFDPFITWWNGMTLLQQIFAACAIPATLILIIQSIMLIVGLTGNADSSDNGEGDHDSGDDADTDSPDTDGFDNDSDLDDTSDFDDASDADGLDDASDAGDTDMDDAGSGFDSDTDSDGDGIPDTDQGAGTNYHVSDRNDVNTVRHTGGHHSSGLRLFTIRGIVAFLAIGGWLGVSMIDLKLSPALTVAIAVAGGFAAMLLCALVIRWSVKLQENGTMSLKNAIAHTATVYIPIPPERHGFGKVTMTLQESYVELEAVTDCKDRIPTGTEVLVVGIADKNTLLVRPL